MAKDIFISVYDLRATIFTNQTGKLSLRSRRRNHYQMVVQDMDSNSTWVEPMKNRTEGDMILARRRALSRMNLQSIIPKHQVLDNEISDAYRTEICDTNMTFQLVPPDDHRRNLAERAIQTWKDHFVGVLSETASNFPLHLWCQIIRQAERQLLLLQKSRVNPKISAYAHVYGANDYNSAPFVPIGMETLVHEKPKKRRTFAEHCSQGFVLGTSFEHYQSWTMWMTNTRSLRISATVFHKHKYISNPDVTPADRIIAAARALATLIKGNLTQSLNDISLTHLERLGSILKPEVPVTKTQSPRLVAI